MFKAWCKIHPSPITYKKKIMFGMFQSYQTPFFYSHPYPESKKPKLKFNLPVAKYLRNCYLEKCIWRKLSHMVTSNSLS